MTLQKQSLTINFGQGLDLKTDPKQVPAGKFLSLKNRVFNKGGLLEKRYGFASLPSLPDSTNTTLTTLNNNLIALGENLYALEESNDSWLDAGNIKQIGLTVASVFRGGENVSVCDAVVHSNGLALVLYADDTGAWFYRIITHETGVVIYDSDSTPLSAQVRPKSFVLGNYFIIVSIEGSNIKYASIPVSNPSASLSFTTVASNALSPTAGMDAFVANNVLYVAYAADDVGGAIRYFSLTSSLVLSAVQVTVGVSPDEVSVTADITGGSPVIWFTYFTSGGPVYCMAVNTSLATVLAPQTVISGTPTVEFLASTAQNSTLTVFADISNTYSFTPNNLSNYIRTNTCTVTGTVGTASVLVRGVSLASRAFLFGGISYFLAAYGSESNIQPSLFLINGSGEVVCKLAYSSASGYLGSFPPNITVIGDNVYIPYLYRAFINTVTSNGTTSNIYAQLGVNLATFDMTPSASTAVEIGNTLTISGGIVWTYDGDIPVESVFNVFPDDITATWSDTGGNMEAQPDGATNTNAYAYQVTYEWTDNAGNIVRSAPSIPVFVTTTGTGSIGSVTLNIPTLRLTAKTGANPPRITIYRWSVGEPVYHQVTGYTSSGVILNDTTVDSISYVDVTSDAQIEGRNIIYTNGGVIENIAPPASDVVALYKSRVFLIDSENRNTLWFSKQVIQGTPVEMSDLFTIYVPPTTGTQGVTGRLTAICGMDDKLIIFKNNNLFYITGSGPDNTGANNDFSDPVFITSTVGCENQNSIVLTPNGIMFQSNGKGIWLLGRDLSTSFIGADVDEYNNDLVRSAQLIPETNQVRFTMDSGDILVYDYYYGQWGSFDGVSAISSAIQNGLHTLLDSNGDVYQETSGTYLDGSDPVTTSFETGWISMGNIQGFGRIYYFYLLANYLSPHTLTIDVYYDYEDAISQSYSFTPDSSESIEQFRMFFNRQKCQAFKIRVTENYVGPTAGAGLSISGINFVLGVKSSYPRLNATQSVG